MMVSTCTTIKMPQNLQNMTNIRHYIQNKNKISMQINVNRIILTNYIDSYSVRYYFHKIVLSCDDMLFQCI